MADYSDEGDFCENFDYCNIHGEPLTVLQADSGDLYVNLKDIRKTGFAIFRRDTFDTVLVDNRQIGKEFELHLLSEAKNYILKNRVASIDEEQILMTIERCRNKLLGDNTKNTFGAGRLVSKNAQNITITSQVQEQEAGLPMIPQTPQSRPPRTLPTNFSATHVQRGGSDNFQRGARDGIKQNNINGPKPSNYPNRNSRQERESDPNSSSSSETQNNFKKPRAGFDNGDRNKPQRSQREPREELSKLVLEQGCTYDVVISYKEDKENICWVQDKRHAKDLEDVIIQVNEMVEELEPVTPFQGQLVAAEYEGMWNRGRVFNLDPLMVHFVDYGNKSGVGVVKALPAAVKSTPALAVRMVINGVPDLTEEMELEIRIKKKYDDGTYIGEALGANNSKRDSDPTSVRTAPTTSKPSSDFLVEKQPDPAPAPAAKDHSAEPPSSKLYFDIPKPMVELQNGDKIMLIGMENNKFFAKTKECVAKSKAMTEYIKNLDKSTLILPKVNVGQLVLSSKDGFVGLFRAVVTKRENDLIATVKYVDYAGEADLSVKSLRNVDEFLAKEPATILMTPLCTFMDNLNMEGMEYVANICQNKEKFTVVLSKNNFDLQAENGTLLSHALNSLKCPKLVPQKPSTAKAAPPKEVEPAETSTKGKTPAASKSKVLYDEMDWIKMEPAQHTLMCYYFQDISNITFLASTDEVIGHLETITSASPTDDTPYAPEELEMCLVSYKGPDDDEATWYRAVVTAAEDDGYLVNFVDFGNIEPAQAKDIRRFPSYLKDIPILGVTCECTGIPDKPEILERLKELMPEGTQVEVVIKELDGLKYQIELPELYKQLKAEKLF